MNSQLLDDQMLEDITPNAAVLDVQSQQGNGRYKTFSNSYLSSQCNSNNAHCSSLSTSDDVPLLRVSASASRSRQFSFQQDEAASRTDTPLRRTLESDHCHIQKAGQEHSKKAIRRLIFAAVLTGFFMIGEAIGGYMASSIAIMSDAAHLLSDLTSFIVSLTAIYLAMRPASVRMNFGYYRAEILGALVSVIMIWMITGVLVYAAIQRCISMDFTIEADTMIIVAGVGVVFNIILAILLHASGHSHSHLPHSHSAPPSSVSTSDTSFVGVTNEVSRKPHRNINIRAAFIHVIGDLIQSIGVLISACVIKYHPEYKVADPVCTFIFSILVLITTLPIMRDLSHVLMEGAPRSVDFWAVYKDLTGVAGVVGVHSLHVWALTLDKNACSVHLAVASDADSDQVLRDAQRVIRRRHFILQTTIQVEKYEADIMQDCTQCQPLSR